jgi:hypothetical protein
MGKEKQKKSAFGFGGTGEERKGGVKRETKDGPRESRSHRMEEDDEVEREGMV